MKKASFITGAIFLGIAALTAFTFVLMYLWNWLMPAIFNLGVISFWQAAGLLILSKILFSGPGSGHAQKWNTDRKKRTWHNRFEEKWQRIPKDKKDDISQKMEEKGFHKKEEDI